MALTKWLRSFTSTATNTDHKNKKTPASSNPSPGQVEILEDRLVMDVSLLALGDASSYAGQDLYLPLTAFDDNELPLQFEVESDNAAIKAEVLHGGRSVALQVSGYNSAAELFSGVITFRLFDDVAPITTDQIADLVEQGFYNGLTFHRAIDDFVVQGGDPLGTGAGGAGANYNLPDEYAPGVTFQSPVLVAMANAGDDTGNSQFFFTDMDVALEDLPTHLNYNHTIFGQVTSGFDTLFQMFTTPTDFDDVPVEPIIIESSAVFYDTQNAVLRITTPEGYAGTGEISVTASNGDVTTEPMTFNISVEPDTVNDRPYLEPVSDLVTKQNESVHLQLKGYDADGDTLAYTIGQLTGDPNNPDITASINQATGEIIITPVTGFTGTINLIVEVTDSYQNDTDQFTLTVTADVATPSTPTMADGHSSVVKDGVSPKITVDAVAGSTVEILLDGDVIGTATETSTPGKYTYVINNSLLSTGNHVITAQTTTNNSGTILTSDESAGLNLSYAPSLKNVFVAPGIADGDPVVLTFTYSARQASLANEIGVYYVDDAQGTIDGLAPGDEGYFDAALNNSNHVAIFNWQHNVGQQINVTVPAGQRMAFYLISGGDTTALLDQNPTNDASEGVPVAFFGLTAANPDGAIHMQSLTDDVAGEGLYSFEDLLGGGDGDYNDAIISVRAASNSTNAADVGQAIRVPRSATETVVLSVELQEALKAITGQAVGQAGGEFGYYYVDDIYGSIGSYSPSDAQYAQAALSSLRRQPLFINGDTASTSRQVAVPGGSLIGFYYIPAANATDVLINNPTNEGERPFALFSFDAASADGLDHFRWTTPEGVQRAGLDADPLQLSIMAALNGTESDFGDLLLSIQFETLT